MTYLELKEKIKRTNTFERYMWYVLFSLLFVLSIWLFYVISLNPEKFKIQGTPIYAYLLSILIFGCGIYSIFYLIPNRYKILSINSPLSLYSKGKVINELFSQLKIKVYDTSASYYYYEYGKSLLSWGYNIHIAIDTGGFYISVQGRTGGGRYGGGFVYLGGTERLRKKLVSKINALLAAG